MIGARASLAMTAPAALRAGSVRIAVWSFSWLAYAEFVVGAWDEAAADAERAVSLLDESGHGVAAAAGPLRGGAGARRAWRVGGGRGAPARAGPRRPATTS